MKALQRYLDADDRQNGGGLSIEGTRNELRQMMTQNVGVFRQREGLEQALSRAGVVVTYNSTAGLEAGSAA